MDVRSRSGPMFELSGDLSSVESRSAQWSPDQLNITLAKGLYRMIISETQS